VSKCNCLSQKPLPTTGIRTRDLWLCSMDLRPLDQPAVKYIHRITQSSSSSAYYSPLLDIGLSNVSPSRSIFGYSHPSPASRPAQIVTPPDLRASCPTLRLPRRSLHSITRIPQRLSVLRLIWPAHCHFSMLIRCAMSVTLVLCRITWFRIRSRRETPSIDLSIAR
jgi:hypothetical protein